jgi:hypothetical protein
VSSDAHTPAQRADAVLRAAEAAAAAAQAAAYAAHAASLPEPEPSAPAAPVVAAEPESPPESDPEPPIHEAGAAGRLLAAAGDLEAHVAQARAQLDALEDALARLERFDPPAD